MLGQSKAGYEFGCKRGDLIEIIERLQNYYIRYDRKRLSGKLLPHENAKFPIIVSKWLSLCNSSMKELNAKVRELGLLRQNMKKKEKITILLKDYYRKWIGFIEAREARLGQKVWYKESRDPYFVFNILTDPDEGNVSLTLWNPLLDHNIAYITGVGPNEVTKAHDYWSEEEEQMVRFFKEIWVRRIAKSDLGSPVSSYKYHNLGSSIKRAAMEREKRNNERRNMVEYNALNRVISQHRRDEEERLQNKIRQGSHPKKWKSWKEAAFGTLVNFNHNLMPVTGRIWKKHIKKGTLDIWVSSLDKIVRDVHWTEVTAPIEPYRKISKSEWKKRMEIRKKLRERLIKGETEPLSPIDTLGDEAKRLFNEEYVYNTRHSQFKAYNPEWEY